MDIKRGQDAKNSSMKASSKSECKAEQQEQLCVSEVSDY